MGELPPTPYDTVCISGGFDPIHIGHVRLIEEASHRGQLIIIVNSDDWLMNKKGYIFMPFEERCEILRGFKGVYDTVAVEDSDSTVCEALKRIKPTYFANGGDRKTHNTPEMEVCQKEGIGLLWNVGGGKVQSSSDLISSSGVLKTSSTIIDEIDLTPSRVELIASGDVSKKSKY